MAMIVNTAWLQEYLESPCSHAELVRVLPAIGLELEQCHALHDALRPIRIGFIRSKREIPDAPGMHHCEIEIERGRRIPVVCASEHPVHVGRGVPVATAGVELPTGRVIRADQYHGFRSEGMICLDGELGLLARGSGLQEFDDEGLLGAALPDVVELAEYLLELNVLPNRPDFLGLIGIAREVAAALRTTLRVPPAPLARSEGTCAAVPVSIERPDWCSRYLGGLIQNVRVQASPSWFKSRLYLAGLRPINNIVDVTNYVMYEWGQPLHAFDFDCLRGGQIVVRTMAFGESLELLTGKVIELGDRSSSADDALLVIADGERPVALAGVMGGSATQTHLGTVHVLLEAAHFDPVQIRSTVNRVPLGLEGRGTQSSYRFERGTDPNTTLENAFHRALQLIRELAGGQITAALADNVAARREPAELVLRPERLRSVLGKPIDAPTIRDCLTRLRMDCSGDAHQIVVRVPTWRVDVNDPVVLMEDVARMLGYDQIPTAPTATAPTLGARGALDQLRQLASQQLVSSGFFETRNPSLEAPESSSWLAPVEPALALRNFETREMSVLRRSLLPGLAVSVQNNIRRAADAVRLFEVDRVFASGPPRDGEPRARGHWSLSAMAGGVAQRSNWRDAGEALDLFQLKGTVEDLLEALGIRSVQFESASAEPYRDGTAAVFRAATGEPLGRMGEIDPARLKIERLLFRLFAFELDLEACLELAAALPSYRALGRHPAVTRDLAFVLPMSASFGALRQAIERAAGEHLEQLRLLDRYQGPQVAAGHHSLAFHLIFRHPDRTLNADEVSTAIDHVIAEVKRQFGGELRV